MRLTKINGNGDRSERLEEQRGKIQELGLEALEEFFTINSKEDIDKQALFICRDKAKLAMQFERESNLQHRALELNHIRIFRLIAKDKDELKQLISKTLPRYLNH